jgi:hypothetical protein
LSLAPLYAPDEGIENFTKLALKYNPDIRILVQEIWLRWDIYEPTTAPPATVDHNAVTIEELRKRHSLYFKNMDDYVRTLNKKFGKTVLYVVPSGQAVLALREKIVAGQVPGLKTQQDLFIDPVGHPTPQLQVLVSYCHFAVTYRRSPVGLPIPSMLVPPGNPQANAKLVKLLQEIAWEAAVQHPLSGLQVDPRP